MGHKATDVVQQIKKLKSRGMIMDLGEDKVKEVLLDIGHYRLGFYRFPFEIDKKHNLKKGTKFSEVLALYYLDVDLRNLLIKYLNRIETNFKTHLIYLVSNKYIKNNTWFVDDKVVSIDFIEGKHRVLKGGVKSKQRYGGFKKAVYTESFKNNNTPLKRHHNKYKNCTYAPAWKTIEFLTFGQSFTTYTSLLDLNLKKDISKVYGIESVSKFENYIRTLVDLRNACAHGNVLFDYKSKNAISSLPFLEVEKGRNQSLGACINVLVYFIDILSTNRKVDFLSDIENVFNIIKKQFPQNIATIDDTISNKMMIKL